MWVQPEKDSSKTCKFQQKNSSKHNHNHHHHRHHYHYPHCQHHYKRTHCSPSKCYKMAFLFLLLLIFTMSNHIYHAKVFSNRSVERVVVIQWRHQSMSNSFSSAPQQACRDLCRTARIAPQLTAIFPWCHGNMRGPNGLP